MADETTPPSPRAALSLQKGRWVFSRFVGVRVTAQLIPHSEAWEARGCGMFGPDLRLLQPPLLEALKDLSVQEALGGGCHPQP